MLSSRSTSSPQKGRDAAPHPVKAESIAARSPARISSMEARLDSRHQSQPAPRHLHNAQLLWNHRDGHHTEGGIEDRLRGSAQIFASRALARLEMHACLRLANSGECYPRKCEEYQVMPATSGGERGFAADPAKEGKNRRTL
jgi:hypothetical protein